MKVTFQRAIDADIRHTIFRSVFLNGEHAAHVFESFFFNFRSIFAPVFAHFWLSHLPKYAALLAYKKYLWDYTFEVMVG